MKTIKGRVSHFDDDYKIIIIGDTNVGKSCLLYSFLHNNFYKNTTQTIGAEFGSKIVRTSDDKIIKLNIWDTAGQEKFRSIAANYYKGALGAIIVFDVTNMNSYLNLTHWISDAKEMGNDGISILITGNKKDKENERIIEPEEAANFSGEHGCLYQETSALFGSNVDDLFQKIAKSITYQIENNLIVRAELNTKQIDRDEVYTSLKLSMMDSDDKSKKKCCS